MKLLKEILYKTNIEQVAGSTSVNISDIAFDSRKVSEWSLPSKLLPGDPSYSGLRFTILLCLVSHPGLVG